MIEKLKARLIGDARYWYKMWSSWLAAAWGVVVTAVWVEPTYVQQLLNMLPEHARAKLSPAVFIVAAGLPVLVRLLKQSKLPGDAK